MNQSLEPSSSSHAGLTMFLVCFVEACRTLFLARLPDGDLVKHIPDDAFYYLQAAKHFAGSGRWTFDGVEPSSGFHLLWGYFLAAAYALHSSSSLHELFIVSSVVHSLCLGVAAFMLTVTAERFTGRGAWGGVLLVFLSASSLLQGTWMMEAPLVILCSAATLYLLARGDRTVELKALAFAFSLGVVTSFARSDSGLLGVWLLVAQIYLCRHGKSSRGMVAAASLLVLGAIAGAVLISFHTHWVSGQWAQASAQEKFYWATRSGRAARPGLFVATSFFNPFTNAFNPFSTPPHTLRFIKAIALVPRVVWLGLIGAGLIAGFRSTRRLDWLAFSWACLLSIVSYLFFYRYNSAATQLWYVANFQAPMALLVGMALACFFRHHLLLMLGPWLVMCAAGIGLSFHPSDPWGEAAWRAGIYLRARPDLCPVGAWNAGILGYFAGDCVTNVDGLMNDTILGYSRTGTLRTYFAQHGIHSIVDSPQIWDPDMASRGGYGNGSLAHCIRRSQDLFPEDRNNNYHWSHIHLYNLDPDCLAAQ